MSTADEWQAQITRSRRSRNRGRRPRKPPAEPDECPGQMDIWDCIAEADTAPEQPS